MLVRPDRLLPSVIVGALLTGALALGAGTASAAPTTCKSSDGVDFVVKDTISVLTGSLCSLSGSLGSTAEELKAADWQTLAQYEAALTPATGGNESAGAGSGGSIIPGVDPIEENPLPADSGTSTDTDESAGGTGNGTAEGSGGTGAAVTPGGPAQGGVQPASALPAPDVRGAVAAPALAAAPGGLAATVPLLNFGTPNPALLLAPPGSPLRTLAGENTGSPVTTTSDVQAIAFDNMPGGMGTPAVVGVLILSTLGAFALRHRMLRRARTPVSSER